MHLFDRQSLDRPVTSFYNARCRFGRLFGDGAYGDTSGAGFRIPEYVPGPPAIGRARINLARAKAAVACAPAPARSEPELDRPKAEPVEAEPSAASEPKESTPAAATASASAPSAAAMAAAPSALGGGSSAKIAFCAGHFRGRCKGTCGKLHLDLGDIETKGGPVCYKHLLGNCTEARCSRRHLEPREIDKLPRTLMPGGGRGDRSRDSGPRHSSNAQGDSGPVCAVQRATHQPAGL